MNKPLLGKKFTIGDVISSLADGWELFLAIPRVSIAYTSIFAVIGLILLSLIAIMGVSLMALPFAGGFMLVGPILLGGFFKIADHHYEAAESVSLADAILALKNAPAQLWIISLVCSMLFLVWITDAAILYVITVGMDDVPNVFAWTAEYRSNVIAFGFWGSVMGSAIAFLIFSVSAFSVPLLYQNRTTLVSAVIVSVKTVFGNFISSLFWGIILSALMMVSILILPIFIVALPVLAFASYSLHKKVFPPAEDDSNE